MKPQLKQIKPYNPPLQNRDKMVRLDFNENTSDYNPCIGKVLSKLSAEGISRYPAYDGLNEKIAGYAGVKENMVLPTNGCDEGIKLVIDAFVSGDEEVIIPKPTFSLFFIYAQAAGAKIISPQYGKNGSFPAREVLDSINKKTKLVIVCSPNNPTGTTIGEKELEQMLKKTRNGAVLVDEAYFEFSGKTFAGLLEKYNNLIISRTFSKAFGLAGLRIGYLLSNAETLQAMKSIYSPYAVNTIAKEAVIECLNSPEYMKDYVSEVNENKTRLERFLEANGINFVKSEANFILADFKESGKFIVNSLFRQGILVRCQQELEGKARITIGDKEKNSLLIETLGKILLKPLLIFDIDGTLIDVSNSYRRAIRETVKFFSGREITDREIQEIRNNESLNNDWEITGRILERYGKKVPLKQIRQKFQEFYSGKNFDGFIKNEKLLINKAVLNKISEKYELAVFTGRPAKEAEFILDYFKIKGFFSAIICMEDCAKEKPDPEGLQKIISNSVFKKAVYFGDSAADLETAKNAGIVGIGVMPNNNYSAETEESLKRAGAKSVLNSINEIEVVLE
jgi:histidinol-phosphate aminotransferase